MDKLTDLKTNIKNNYRLWIILWLLLLLNAYTFFTLSKSFSWLLTILFLMVALLGIGLLSAIARTEKEEKLISLTELKKTNVDWLMTEIKPLCDEIFAREIDKGIEPIIGELEKEFSKGLIWLWENMDDFVDSINQNMGDLDTIPHLVSTLSSDKTKIIEDLNHSILSIDDAILQVKQTKGEDFSMLAENLHLQRNNLIASMEKEKDTFYDHIYTILLEHSEQEEDFNPVEHFNTYKLGDQFTSLISKSLQEKLDGFNDIAVEQLADFSSDVVGRMQKNTTNLLNAFRENQAVLERLLGECKGESNLLLHRIDETLLKSFTLQEKAAEILVTLAWQDILVEKRWQEVKEQLYLVRDIVQNSVEEEVFEYIKSEVEREIPSISYMVKQADGAVFYKSLLDAELIYQVYQGDKLKETLGDGVKVLLQFTRPLEMLVSHSVRLNEQGLQMRKGIRQKAKSGEFNEKFTRVKDLVEKENAQLSKYLEDIFPQEFYAFLNSPYIKKKPDNLSSAAWSIFLSLIEMDGNDELYILTGLLLAIHKLRNKYIHPLRSKLIELTDTDDIELMRHSTYLIINLIIKNELKGITSLSYKYK